MISGCDTVETCTPASACQLADLWNALAENMTSLELEMLELKSYGYSALDIIQEVDWKGSKLNLKGKLKAVYSALSKAKQILDPRKRQ